MSYYPPPSGTDGRRPSASRYGQPPPPPPPPSQGSNSYRPPPPPSSSLPPRPPPQYDSYSRDNRDRYGDRDNGRDNRSGRYDRDDRYDGNRHTDAYHPLPPRPQGGSYREYRDSRDSRDSRNSRDSRDTRAFGGGDLFRPPQSDFTFRTDKPSGVGDSYRPPEPAGPRGPARGPARSSYQDRRFGAGNSRGRGGGPRRVWKPFRPAERAILQGAGNAQPSEDFADAENGVTYKAIDQLSDSDETDMDMSDSDNNELTGPAAKRVRTIAQPKNGDNAPKWSNPDPYTALPPVEESDKKRKDMVQLIRKARVETAANARASLPAPADDVDFIRCDSDSDEQDIEEDEEEAFIDPLTYNRGNASAQGASVALNGPPRDSTKPSLPALLVASGSGQVAPTTNQTLGNGKQRAANVVDLKSSSSLGSRKRTHDDVLKLPEHARLKPASKQPVGGAICKDWRTKSGEHSCPWARTPPPKAHISARLHMEVRDFYEHVKPREFEERLRRKLVDDLNLYLKQNADFPDRDMHPFGSFMSGLYLPTGDMDLVFCSRGFVNGGLPRMPNERQLKEFVKFIRKSPLAVNHHVEPILKARVPLVKYCDNTTGLKIDISFENTGGLVAINTFKAWKDQWPAMPILVTVIKQFLLMRGLNEPVNGGIGGFSVICMVVSMLQMMPAVQSGDMDPQHDLGSLLMHFFDLYGNRFNYETTALRLNPPGYVNKNQVREFTYKNPRRLSIIDPTNPANDIAGGSGNYRQIVFCFREAYKQLQERLLRVAADEPFDSILSVILGGNYSTFRTQRQHLRKLYQKVFGYDDDDDDDDDDSE